MFKFYYERGRLSEFQLQKVQEIQQRWKSGLVFWLTHDNQEIEIPEWVAVNVIINNKQNIGRGSRICMSLNHTKGYGCNRLIEGTCTYVHECALCGQDDHGVFQKKANGSWICTRLRKWYEEEERYKVQGYGDPRKHEDTLTELARRPRTAKAPARKGADDLVKICGSRQTSGPVSQRTPPDAKAAPLEQSDIICQKHAEVCSRSADEIRPHRLPPPQPPPPRLPQNWQAIWCDQQQQYYFWNTVTSQTTWTAPELDEGTLEAARAAVLRARSSQVSSCLPVKPQEPGTSKEVSYGWNRFQAIDAGSYVCTQHWRPQPGVESCLRVFHGERLVVTWVDGNAGGWAYGHVAGDKAQAGYFPQAVLAAGECAPRLLAAGETSVVAERFMAPEEVGGYLSVAPGDVLRALHNADPPGAWAYMEREVPTEPGSKVGGMREVGWVPTVVLKGLSKADECQPRMSPHPAG